jgi:hypothetical protein
MGRIPCAAGRFFSGAGRSFRTTGFSPCEPGKEVCGMGIPRSAVRTFPAEPGEEICRAGKEFRGAGQIPNGAGFSPSGARRILARGKVIPRHRKTTRCRAPVLMRQKKKSPCRKSVSVAGKVECVNGLESDSRGRWIGFNPALCRVHFGGIRLGVSLADRAG